MNCVKLKMALLMCACCVAASATAASRVATEAWVTNKIAQAIEGGGDAPGNYEAVSNRAMKVSLPGDEGHPGNVYTPIFKGRANLAEGALELTKSGQMAYPGRLKLISRSVELPDGAITSVMWPSFLDASSTERWVAAEPAGPEVTSSLRWRADGTACVVTVESGGTLSADISNWTEGQAVMAVITLAQGAGIEQGIELVGYGAWPTGTPFVACCYRIGLTVFVVPSTTL